jgi:L-alanine-DL-glutamate epimerase-like enolase superfamily enzyme
MSSTERAGALAEYADFSCIKLKMGSAPDEGLVAEVRKASNARLSVDANASWLGIPALDWTGRLAEAGVIFLEQPFPPTAAKQSAWLNREGALPVFADESCVVEGDVPGLADSFSGCNIKLVKCGGLTPALRMLKKARSLGLKTMVGCMLESSLLISAGGVLAQGTDYADLDGAWLLGDDPFTGAPLVKGVLQLSGGSGLGVTGMG